MIREVDPLIRSDWCDRMGLLLCLSDLGREMIH